ncbi:IQANK1 [Symbiodinium sp. CCMP2456]|nr:IQANK1 [Symbiodinium sp. CCMP2456]
MAPKKGGKPAVPASRSPTPTAAGSGAAAVTAKTKGAAKAKGKAKAKAKAAPSPEEAAAIRLQSLARAFLARRAAQRLCEEKQRQDAELAAAVRAAELAALQVERRKAEAERAKQEEKRKKAQKLLADTKAALEAAFDGDVDVLAKLLNSGLPVDAANAAGITALSEAAAAGKAEAAQLLLDRKANPNTRGEFSRTPLWRAAYSRQSDLVPLLLEAGGDPRLRDDDGQTPADVCAQDELCELLAAWDVSRTDELVEDFQEWAAELQRQEHQRQREAMRSVEEAFEAAAKSYEAAQMILAKAKAQMRNREKEYGMKLAAGHKDAMEACASADAALQRAEADAASAQHDFDQAQRRRLAAAEAAGAEVASGPGRSVPVAELNNVLLRDLGERIAQGGRWPLVLDPGDIAQKLIQYSGSSLLNFFRPGDMEPERIRVALLTMLRGGGVLALDLHNFGAGVGLDLLSQPFENVRENLFQDICSRELLQVPKGKRMPNFYDLVTKEERQERFKAQMFDDKMIARFKFMVLTSTELPHKDLLEHFDVLGSQDEGNGIHRQEPGNSAGAAEASQPTSPVDEAVANTDANRSPCSNARLEQEASISKSPAEEELPDAESGSAAPEDAIAAAAAPLRRPRRGPSTKLAIILISVVLLAIAAELWIMSMPQVPLLIDKLYFAVALAFQLMMVLASLPLPEQGLCCIKGICMMGHPRCLQSSASSLAAD